MKIPSRQMSDSGDLGNSAKLCNPPPSRNALRYALQDEARDILGGRLHNCHRALSVLRKRDTPIRKANSVSVLQHKSGSLSYGNLQTCGSVWVCPVCSAKIASHRREDMSKFIDNVYASGFVISMLTLTTRHDKSSDLADLLKRMSEAKRYMQNRKPWKKLKDDIGMVGDVRCLEVTHGGNGWHPHFHCLLVHEKNVNMTPEHHAETIKNQMFFRDCANNPAGMWVDALRSAGLSCEEAGVSVVQCEKRSSKALGDYIAKMGIDFEVTHGANKAGKIGGKAPFQLLAASADGNFNATMLFRQYAEAFRGKQQLVFSKGLRVRFAMPTKEQTDQDLSESGQDSKPIMFIPLPIWAQMCKENTRGKYLDMIELKFPKIPPEKFISSIASSD